MSKTSPEELYNVMSQRTMKRIMAGHLREYRKPRRLTDYCQICSDMDDKLLPEVQGWMAHWRTELQSLLPGFFDPWDRYLAEHDMKALMKGFSWESPYEIMKFRCELP